MHSRPPGARTHHLTLYLSTGIITIGCACATKTSGARDDPCSESRKKGTAGVVGGTAGGEGLVAEAVDEEATIRVRGLVSQ